MTFLKDILPIFKKHEISFIESYREVGDIFTFIFQKEKDVKWKSGQHGIFTITHEKINKATRAFSIASTSDEGHVKISMRISENPSEFKKAFMDLKPGMKMSMRGPIGSFYIHDNRPTLLIAGGIGITPYRAILKDLMQHTDKIPSFIKLLYIDSSEEYIYKDEFDSISNDSEIIIKYLTKREDLTKEIVKFSSEYGNEGNYFMVGSKKMIQSTSKLLKEQKIKRSNIEKDTFIGY